MNTTITTITVDDMLRNIDAMLVQLKQVAESLNEIRQRTNALGLDNRYLETGISYLWCFEGDLRTEQEKLTKAKRGRKNAKQN